MSQYQKGLGVERHPGLFVHSMVRTVLVMAHLEKEVHDVMESEKLV